MIATVLFSRRALLAAGLLALLAIAGSALLGQRRRPEKAPPLPSPPPPLFTNDERGAIKAYWGEKERYTVEPSPDVYPTPFGRTWIETTRRGLPTPLQRGVFDRWLAARQTYEAWTLSGKKSAAAPPDPGGPPVGPNNEIGALFARERVNITVEGSAWYKELGRTIAARRAAGRSDEADDLAAWAERRIAFERAKINGVKNDALPPAPGDAPAWLKTAPLGEPPALFERVRPIRYTVTFAPGDAPAPFVYTDAVPFGDRAAYFPSFRSKNGVIRAGRRLREDNGAERARTDALFARVAASDRRESRVLRAVSALEGGWEAVNTYDTGWVSIGFIQFITAREGTGSLAAVLQQHKTDDPADFAQTFHRFGIDVAAQTMIAVVDPASGVEKRGEAAVKAIIDDKRLTAVFERAGLQSDAFRLAQIRVARARYWPGDDLVTVTIQTLREQTTNATTTLGTFYTLATAVPASKALLALAPEKRKRDPNYRVWLASRTLSAPVSRLVRSEAGLATLMDRKVNRGNIRGISEIAAALMKEHKLTRIEDLAAHEKALVSAMKYRADFLADASLTQPK